MKSYTVETPKFSESITIPETTDTNHADNINSASKQLLQNDLVLQQEMDELKKTQEEQQETLADVEPGANKTVVDSAMSITSTNPVENKVISDYVYNMTQSMSQMGQSFSQNMNSLNQQIQTTKANIDSPTFTGEPKAPTPKESSNNTQIATTAFVKMIVAALVDGAPEMMDTFKEVSDAFKENDNVIDALNAAIGLKAGKDEIPTSLPANGGTADKAKMLIGNDNRETNEPPSYYMGQKISIVTEFKRRLIIGLPEMTGNNFVQLTTFNQFSDINNGTGGFPSQIATGVVDGNIYYRKGLNVNDWGEWKNLSETYALFSMYNVLNRIEDINFINIDGHTNSLTYNIAKATVNGGAPTDAGILTFGWDSQNFMAQLAMNLNINPRMFIRGCNNNGWDNKWLEIITEKHINSKRQAGIVPAGEGHPNQIYGTDSEGNPEWRDLTPANIGAAEYEEGNWTPIIGYDSGNTVDDVPHVSSWGMYEKIGKSVHLKGHVILDSPAQLETRADFYIKNIPFPMYSTGNIQSNIVTIGDIFWNNKTNVNDGIKKPYICSSPSWLRVDLTEKMSNVTLIRIDIIYLMK